MNIPQFLETTPLEDLKLAFQMMINQKMDPGHTISVATLDRPALITLYTLIQTKDDSARISLLRQHQERGLQLNKQLDKNIHDIEEIVKFMKDTEKINKQIEEFISSKHALDELEIQLNQ